MCLGSVAKGAASGLYSSVLRFPGHQTDWRRIFTQGPTATIESFESLDFVGPTVKALERVVAHQQRRKGAVKEFFHAKVRWLWVLYENCA